MQFVVKTIVTALIVAGVSEISRRYSLIAAILASLPLTSILAFIWLYQDTADVKKVAVLSNDIFWMVIPSLFFFIVFPILLKNDVKFYPALISSCLAMSAAYAAFVFIKQKYF